MKKRFIIFVLLSVALLISAAGCRSEVKDTVDQWNASQLATALNSFNALYPEKAITSLDNIKTFEAYKAAVGEDLFPRGMDEKEFNDALRFLIMANGKADIRPLGY
jgi:ectoine hydroxylase-related dioxygenase (phytanoyl-CoA dioxygenase family)